VKFPLIRKHWSAAKAATFIALAAPFFVNRPIAAQGRPQTHLSALESEFQAAMAARDRGDVDRAKEILVALRREHPGIFAVDESLGLIYVAQQQYGDALPLLRAAVREQPSSDVAHTNLGADLFKLQRDHEALDEYTLAARLNPKNGTTQQGLGELWLDAGKPERAAEAFSMALEGKPDDPDLQMDLATALVAAGKFDKALDVLNKVPETDASADAQVLFGQIEEAHGHPVEATHHFDRAVQLEPTEANVWALGVELLRHWTFEPAIREFEAAAAKFPQSRRILLGLGTAYFGNGNYAASIPVFAGLLKSDPGNVLYADLLGMSCTAVMQEARPQCSSLIVYAQDHPRDARASVYAAANVLQGSPTDEQLRLAEELLRNAIAASPRQPDARYQMGVLQQSKGDWAGSVANLEAAVALKPDLAEAHYRLALAYWRSGRRQQAQNQMALHQKYSKQQKEDLDQRLRQITTFVVNGHN
jgi:tetratricopeptide (TPR) repeat protein